MREAMLCGAQIAVLAVSEKEPGDILSYAQSQGAAVVKVPSHVMERICDTKTPQGIAAALRLPEKSNAFGQAMLALDRIADPGNLGTMLRSAGGVRHIGRSVVRRLRRRVFPQMRAFGHGRAFQALHSRGEFGRRSWKEKSRGIRNHRRVPSAGSRRFQRFRKKRIYVIGSEAHGLSVEVTGRVHPSFPHSDDEGAARASTHPWRPEF